MDIPLEGQFYPHGRQRSIRRPHRPSACYPVSFTDRLYSLSAHRLSCALRSLALSSSTLCYALLSQTSEAAVAHAQPPSVPYRFERRERRATREHDGVDGTLLRDMSYDGGFTHLPHIFVGWTLAHSLYFRNPSVHSSAHAFRTSILN